MNRINVTEREYLRVLWLANSYYRAGVISEKAFSVIYGWVHSQ